MNTHRIVTKANININKWGLQTPDTILLAMMKELGELTQAFLQYNYENGDYQKIDKEIYDLLALCEQFERSMKEVKK